MRRLALAAVVLASACGDSSTPGLSTGPGVTSASPSSTSSTSSAGSSSTSGSCVGLDDSAAASSASGVGALDMDLPPDFGDPQPQGCKGKIDFLFLISRSATMKQEQEQLLASLPGFITTIADSFAEYQPHILVGNPDGDWTPDNCDTNIWGCGMHAPNCGPGAEDYTCYAYEVDWPCDMEVGAGLLFNAGPDATNVPCVLQNGRRYITPDEPNALEAFLCMAQVGTLGPDTPILDALFAAVQPKLNGPGGCNEGFLRPDALLVVTMIFDSGDIKSWKKPQQVYDAVVAAKGGDPDAVVTVVITFPTTNEAQKPGCAFGDYPDPLKKLALLFPYNVIGDACADSYTPYLELAADKVAEACGKFIPQ